MYIEIPVEEATDKRLTSLKSGDILLSRVFSREPKLSYVEEKLKEPILLSSSIILIRINTDNIRSKDVYNFLNSDTGKRALLLFTLRQTAQRHLSVRQLAEIGIFIPEDELREDVNLQLSATRRTINEIEEHILPLLRDVEKSYSSTDKIDQSQVEEAGQRLLQLATVLIPQSLEERILASFPTPISIPYERFLNARFNVFEQVMRLRDVYEATCFFIYNLMLADACQRLDVNNYFIDVKRARKAYDGFSMADRLTFIESLQNLAKSIDPRDLFMPEIVDAFNVKDARILKDDLRNQAAHTATAPESQQRRVLRYFRPIVEDILEKLSFLVNYQLVRITSFFYFRTDLMRRMEVYVGTSPILDEQPFPEGVDLTPADREHLVLLDQESNILDLHPLYQLVANESTNFQSHICFFKQRFGGDKQKLEGESVQGAFTIDLEGFADFEYLRSNLHKANGVK